MPTTSVKQARGGRPKSRDSLFFSLISCTFRVVAESADSETLDRIFRPYAANLAMAFPQNMAERMKGFGESEIIMASWMWANNSFTSAAYEYRVTTGQIVLVNKGCPYGKASPAVCRFVCTHIALSMASLYWSGGYFRQVPGHMIGTDQCVWVASRQAQVPQGIENLQKTDAENLLSRLSSQELDWLHSHAQGELWRLGVQMTLDLLGESLAAESLLAAARMEGQRLGVGQRHGIGEVLDIDDIASAISIIWEGIGQNGEMIRRDSGSISWVVSECPLKGNHPIACLQRESFLDVFTKGTNPAASLCYEEMNSRNDGQCTRVLTINNAFLDGRSEDSGADIDPLKILLSRLAKGEISVDEYREMRSFIENEMRSPPRAR